MLDNSSNNNNDDDSNTNSGLKSPTEVAPAKMNQITADTEGMKSGHGNTRGAFGFPLSSPSASGKTERETPTRATSSPWNKLQDCHGDASSNQTYVNDTTDIENDDANEPLVSRVSFSFDDVFHDFASFDKDDDGDGDNSNEDYYVETDA